MYKKNLHRQVDFFRLQRIGTGKEPMSSSSTKIQAEFYVYLNNNMTPNKST